MPIGVVYAYVSRPDDTNLRLMVQYYDNTVMGADAVHLLVEKVLSDWFVIYLVMPISYRF